MLEISNINSSKELLNKTTVEFDDDLYLYEEVQFNKSIQIWEMYGIHKNLSPKILQYGNWSLQNGFKIINHENKWERRNNLEVISNTGSLLLNCLFLKVINMSSMNSFLDFDINIKYELLTDPI